MICNKVKAQVATYTTFIDEVTVDEVRWAKTKTLPNTVALKKAPTVPVCKQNVSDAVIMMCSDSHSSTDHNKRTVLRHVGNRDDAIEGYVRAEVSGNLPHDKLLVLLAGHRLPVDLDDDIL